MKKLLIFTSLLATLQNCTVQQTTPDDTVISACGVKNPATELPWLKDMIAKAEQDKKDNFRGPLKGNYQGHIYLTKWQGQDAFWTDFSNYSAMKIVDCSGASVVNEQYLSTLNAIERKEFEEAFMKALRRDVMIYSNVPN